MQQTKKHSYLLYEEEIEQGYGMKKDWQGHFCIPIVNRESPKGTVVELLGKLSFCAMSVSQFESLKALGKKMKVCDLSSSLRQIQLRQ